MADLTTLADAKNWLGIPALTTTDDARITTLVSGCSTWIENETGRKFAQASVTETRSGTKSRSMVLNQPPVSAITSVMIDGVLIPQRSAPGAAGWYFANDILYLDGGLIFTKGNANVVIVYTGGYALPPADLALAALKLVAIRYREKEHLGQSSKTLAGETVSFDMKDLPSDVKNIIGNYMAVVWGR